MLAWIIQISIASICFIFLVHHLICFLKNTLTVPKTKDLVTSSMEKYNKMYNILENNTDFTNKNIIDLNNCTSIDSLPTAASASVSVNDSSSFMKDELKSFLKNHLHTESNNVHNIEHFDINESFKKMNYSIV